LHLFDKRKNLVEKKILLLRKNICKNNDAKVNDPIIDGNKAHYHQTAIIT